MKTPRPSAGFGDRLTELRKSRGLTQRQLGDQVGLSQRMIAYYEGEGAQPPGPLLAEFARALGVTADQLLGLKAVKGKADPKQARLLNRLKKVEKLTPNDQRTVLKLIDALADARGNGQRSAPGAEARSTTQPRGQR